MGIQQIRIVDTKQARRIIKWGEYYKEQVGMQDKDLALLVYLYEILE